jgi:hypothetical protein
MLRIVSPDLIHEVDVSGTTLLFKGITVREKYLLLSKIAKAPDTEDTDALFDDLRDTLSPVIVGIKDGMPFKELFDRLEDIQDIRSIIKAVIEYCGLKEAEVKNSDSSSGQPTPASTGNAEKPAEPDGEPASTTQIEKVYVPPEDKG